MIFKIKVTQGYNDAELDGWVSKGEELAVSKERAIKLLNAHVAEIIDIETEQGETLAPAVSEESTSDNDVYEEQLAALAAANGIDISGKSRRQVENLLKKAGVDYAK